MTSHSILTLARRDLLRDKAYIGGRWVDDPAGGGFPVSRPDSGSVIAQVADGGPELARQAADAAARAFVDWRASSAGERAGLVRAWCEAVLRHGEDLARLVSLETGKPLREARAEITYGASYLEWFAEEAKRAGGEVIPSPWRDRRMMAIRAPVGIVAVVTPWNFPVAMLARKIGPALAAGCTVVAKPSEDTPLSALALAVLAEEVGIPSGVLNIVPASRARSPALVQAWLDDARVRKLSFTGSTMVGKQLAAGAAATLKRLSLELGGDAPFLVFEDADIDTAVSALMAAKFRNAGQACIAANRILVQETIFDAFTARLLAAVSQLRVGGPEDEANDIGPLINRRAVEKVEGFIADAVARGARVLAGGRRHDAGESFFQPTVLVDAAGGPCTEIFGPVAALSRFSTEAEAIRIANDTPYGLAAYVCTHDLARTIRLSEALEAGILGVNEGAVSSAAAPFGGVKESGYGREGSVHGLAEYQDIKYICLGGCA